MTKPVEIHPRQLREKASLSEAQKRALVWGETPKRQYRLLIVATATFAFGVVIGFAAMHVL